MRAEAHFRAMGSDAHVLIVGGGDIHLATARHRIADLEARWSRFRPASELCRLNDRGGLPTVLGEDTFRLVATMVAAFHATHGRYDPTVLPALEAAGYDRPIDVVMGDRPAVHDDDDRSLAAAPAPGCSGIRLDPISRCVTVPSGVRLDGGGVAKGLAADLVAAEVRERGARGVLVSLGGDVVVAGEPPDDDGWVVAIADPHRTDPVELDRVRLVEGAVATSGTQRRRWRRHGRPQHHVIDPRTGLPVASPYVAVTAIGGSGWWAEALATSVLVAGDIDVADHGSVLAVRHDGTIVRSDDLVGLAA